MIELGTVHMHKAKKMVTFNGRDFSLQGLMGSDCRLLAGLVSVLCKDENIKNKIKNKKIKKFKKSR